MIRLSNVDMIRIQKHHAFGEVPFSFPVFLDESGNLTEIPFSTFFKGNYLLPLFDGNVSEQDLDNWESANPGSKIIQIPEMTHFSDYFQYFRESLRVPQITYILWNPIVSS